MDIFEQETFVNHRLIVRSQRIHILALGNKNETALDGFFVVDHRIVCGLHPEEHGFVPSNSFGYGSSGDRFCCVPHLPKASQVMEMAGESRRELFFGPV